MSIERFSDQEFIDTLRAIEAEAKALPEALPDGFPAVSLMLGGDPITHYQARIKDLLNRKHYGILPHVGEGVRILRAAIDAEQLDESDNWEVG